MLSDTLRGYFKSDDMKKELDYAGISVDEICFDLDKSIKNKILWALQNREKLEGFSQRMSEVRSWEKIGKEYSKVIREAAR
jgi:hypothetical protein